MIIFGKALKFKTTIILLYQVTWFIQIDPLSLHGEYVILILTDVKTFVTENKSSNGSDGKDGSEIRNMYKTRSDSKEITSNYYSQRL